jgi:hypothetical protein
VDAVPPLLFYTRSIVDSPQRNKKTCHLSLKKEKSLPEIPGEPQKIELLFLPCIVLRPRENQ